MLAQLLRTLAAPQYWLTPVCLCNPNSSKECIGRSHGTAADHGTAGNGAAGNGATSHGDGGTTLCARTAAVCRTASRRSETHDGTAGNGASPRSAGGSCPRSTTDNCGRSTAGYDGSTPCAAFCGLSMSILRRRRRDERGTLQWGWRMAALFGPVPRRV